MCHSRCYDSCLYIIAHYMHIFMELKFTFMYKKNLIDRESLINVDAL
jgi:hypothetical protein